MSNFIDLTGQRFDKLTVIQRVKNDKQNKPQWLCACDCGNKKIIRSKDLNDKRYKTKSCGCSRIKHGHSIRNKISTTYNSWHQMIQRCTNQKCKSYKYYGERGITVCKRWSNKENGFQNFLADMGEKPTNKHQIDRINNNKLINSYSIENCRWALSKENNRNRRSSHLLKHENKELCITEWTEITGIPRRTITRRIKLGWSIKKALTTPVRRHKKYKNTKEK